ncbi:MAG: hypothetical protein WA705_06175 [Candidatus Ozemobacteraceae bacterium]
MPSRPPAFVKSGGFHIWIRFIFSCLVDADILDYKLFSQPESALIRGQFNELHTLKACFDAFMEKKIAGVAVTPVNAIRAQILEHCRAAGKQQPGRFSLTVPTGAAKLLRQPRLRLNMLSHTESGA